MKKIFNEISFWLSALLFFALMMLAASCSNLPRNSKSEKLATEKAIIESQISNLNKLL